ncbi:hypothetical protein GN244_ATG17111 [Phytophthora infestans]|uniref:DDE-1 domain-containing protein n=1 Tax=Phytophthora infestans TaxID=4787 RepID=A0A833RR12_PHYIN|nr:hypothetical protein GN244_ATG17111 [Phytophthora infestans]KAF4134855.1 hypothetical protein GN958_ATG16111 [Phytophthora infestans]
MESVDMYDTVHVSEKIFCVTQPNRRFLLLTDEPALVRHLCIKRYSTRVTFLAALGRSRFNEPTQQCFDGKLAFQLRGLSSMRVDNLLPALHARWLDNDEAIVIQQDSAPTYIALNDVEFTEPI